MKKVDLGSNRFALVSKDNYNLITKYKWHFLSGYAITVSDGNLIYMHRLIKNVPKGKSTDHINGNKLDNRIDNLRICNISDNGGNRKIGKNNTSGFKGVYWAKTHKKWHSYITRNKKNIFLGLFDDKKDAALAYNNAAIKYFGEFSRLNII